MLNPLSRELSAKIVYYGPGLSGKTTNLQQVHSAVRPDRRGNLVSLATRTDRTIFFDFLPLKVERVAGLGVRFQLYTVPGQVFYAATRKLVLKNTDGVVFVADSQPDCRDKNLESLEDLRDNLVEHGLSSIPIVFQYNKQDIEGALPVSEMSALLNTSGAPEFGSAVAKGQGVLETLKEVTRQVIASITKEHEDARPSTPKKRAGSGDSLVDIMAAAARDAPENALARKVAEIVDGSTLRPEARRAAPEEAVHAAPTDRPPVVDGIESGLSFASLWPEDQQRGIREIERYIAAGNAATAVEHATALLAEMLVALPGPREDSEPGHKATLLGLDGREYLRVCRLDSAPSETLTREDALFALHMLVSARIKSERL